VLLSDEQGEREEYESALFTDSDEYSEERAPPQDTSTSDVLLGVLESQGDARHPGEAAAELEGTESGSATNGVPENSSVQKSVQPVRESDPILGSCDLTGWSRIKRTHTEPSGLFLWAEARHSGREMLHVFSGRPRVGGFEDCADIRGVRVTSIDLLLGGAWHDVRDSDVRAALLSQVEAGRWSVVWIGLPCASGTVHWTGAKKRPRLRETPDEAPDLPAWLKRYVDLHNLFLSFTEELGVTAFKAGATVIVENPPDYGDARSPYFRWKARSHCPLWLTSYMMRLAECTKATMYTGCQCMLGGKFKKPTSLLAAGPRAHRLRTFGELMCTHSSHARVAAGWKQDGSAHSADAAAYPVPMCLWAIDTLFSGADEGVDARGFAEQAIVATLAASAVVQQGLNAAAAAALLDGHSTGAEGVRHAWDDDTGKAARLLLQHGEWRSAPLLMPSHWPERQDATGPDLEAALAQELPYLSRRRCEPEAADVLVRRQLPEPHRVPALAARPAEEVGWPDGAPPRPIHISQLYHPGIYSEIRAEVVRRGADMLACQESHGGNFHRVPGVTYRAVPKHETRIWEAAKCQPAWALTPPYGWDCRDPHDCVPQQPFSLEDPPAQEANRSFFLAWGRWLGHEDADMLHQVTVTGAESRARMSKDTVLMGHHAGLRSDPGPAFESVDQDTARGWVTEARADLWTVPTRGVPKNCLRQLKWRLIFDKLVKKLKTRVTTDDSICPEAEGVQVDSRNTTIDRSSWGNVGLPGPRTLAEAVAIIKAQTEVMNIPLGVGSLEKVALWALDLSDAFRALAVARTEWWQQAYVWSGGIKLDLRCVFGSAHLVDLFQRVSTFVLRVAAHRIHEYDRTHPYDAARSAWREWRQAELGDAQTGSPQRETFQNIYIDDASGVTPLSAEEAVQGTCRGDPSPTKVFVGVDPQPGESPPRVRLLIFHGMSRAEVHLGLTEISFREAGWESAPDKMQLGEAIELLGHTIDTRGVGKIHVQEVKRRGIRADIERQRGDARGEVTRVDVEELTGRCSFLAQVICEGKAFLQPMYRLKNQVWTVRDRKSKRKTTVHPSKLLIRGNGHTQKAYRRALDWWGAALQGDVAAPLAPRLVFPRPCEAGCAFLFTDAAREDGTGFGGHTEVTVDGAPIFLWCERRWEHDVLQALQANSVSMPAGECVGAVAFADALLTALGGVTHLIVFTDSDATAKAFTTGDSGAPQLDCAMRWLISRHPLVQFVGRHQPGVRNGAADGLSRQQEDRERVLAEASAAGMAVVQVTLDEPALRSLLREVRDCPLRR
jgi:hypothetical protein